MKKLLVLACLFCFATVTQAKDVSKEQWLKAQEKQMEKAGKKFNAATADKRWAKIDANGDGKLDDEEKAAMKAKNKK